jgi:hypothetical protein
MNSVLNRIALSLGLCLAAPLAASQFAPLSLDALAQKAQLIVHATVQSKSCAQDEAGRIVTRVDLNVIEVWKGELPANPCRIVHGGGELAHKRTVVSGQVDYVVGEEVVAFLVLNRRGEGVTVGLLQGKFTVWADPATSEKLAGNLFHGAASDGSRALQSAKSPPLDRLTLGELKARVKGAAQ